MEWLNFLEDLEAAGELEKLIFVQSSILRVHSSDYRASAVEKDMCSTTAKLDRFSVSGMFLFIL